ncbi:MAG TPA: hypothetical protein VFZ43_11900 [Anaerolineales bacterium]
MNEEITNLIIKKLGKHHDRNEIIRTVCERSTMSWTDAEQFIEQVAAEHKSIIAARQRPLLVLVGVGTLILGFALMFSNSQFIIAFFQQGLLEQLLSLQDGYYRAIGFITGVGMVAGSLIGLGKSFLPLLEE